MKQFFRANLDVFFLASVTALVLCSVRLSREDWPPYIAEVGIFVFTILVYYLYDLKGDGIGRN